MSAQPMFKQASDYNIVNGTYYDKRTPSELVRVLECARQERTKITLVYGDVVTGQKWEDVDLEGRIGRSMGPHKVPLLIRGNEDGGEQLLDHCIIQVISRGKILYCRKSNIS